MKKILVLVLAFALLVTATGCSSLNRRAGEKAGEKMAENILGRLLGSDADVNIDLDENKIVVKDKEGSSLSIGTGEWPDLDYMPKLAGTIVSTHNSSSGSASVILSEVKQKDLDEYLARIKKDYNIDSNESSADSYYSYGGRDSAGNVITVMVYTDEGTVAVSGIKAGS